MDDKECITIKDDLNPVKNNKCITIFGEINYDIAETILNDLIEEEWDDNQNNLDIYIYSEGGFLSACFAIVDIINMFKIKHNIKITTYGVGEIASAGFFLFLLGDNRILYPSCRVFVHEHITIDAESKTYSEKLKEDRTIEKEIYEMYVAYTMTQLSCTKQKAKKLLAKNKWLNKKEIKQFNILGNES